MGLAPVQWLTSGSLLMSENHWGEGDGVGGLLNGQSVTFKSNLLALRLS